VGGILQRGQPRNFEAEWQLVLVDDLHRLAILGHPDRPVMPPVDLHVSLILSTANTDKDIKTGQHELRSIIYKLDMT
jgi:hypothetical protein